MSYVEHILLPVTFQADPQSAASANAVFYIHGSVHHESNLIIVQQDATVFSLVFFCRQLYMFPSALVELEPTRQQEQMVVDPFDQCQKL